LLQSQKYHTYVGITGNLEGEGWIDSFQIFTNPLFKVQLKLTPQCNQVFLKQDNKDFSTKKTMNIQFYEKQSLRPFYNNSITKMIIKENV